jgi:hypothetical protein
MKPQGNNFAFPAQIPKIVFLFVRLAIEMHKALIRLLFLIPNLALDLHQILKAFESGLGILGGFRVDGLLAMPHGSDGFAGELERQRLGCMG